MIWIVCIIGLLKHARHIEESILKLFRKHTLFTIGVIFFLTATSVSVFTAVDLREAAGAWKSFYIEPFILFLVLFFAKDSIDTNMDIVLPLILCGLATSILAVYQHFTGWMVPWAFWENGNTFRVTSWYGFPNGVGLFLAPLVALAGAIIWRRFTTKQEEKWEVKRFGNLALLISCIFLFTVGPLAIWYAKSTGGLIGIISSIGLLLLYDRRTRWPSIAIGLISIISLMNMSSLVNIKDEIFLRDRSGQIRIAIWKETVELLKDRPLLGAGLSSYDERIVQYHTMVNGEGIEIFHHPHNIFLTMWVNLGLLGLIGFLLILIGFYTKGYILYPILITTMTALVVTGLVDSPYIKNDLAVLFWMMPLLLLTSSYVHMENS